MNKNFLFEIINKPSVSGHEINLQKFIIEEMKNYSSKIETDHSGNVINIINEDSNNKILMCAHIDEIGFYVKDVTENGFIKLSKAGGVHPKLYLGTHVQIIHEKDIINGCVITNSEFENNSKLDVENILVDIGANNKKEVLEILNIGDQVCANISYKELLNDRLCARALDDKIGCFVILEALKKAKENNCQNGVYCATTVGEETTMRGAHYVTKKVAANCAIIVDVTFASDYSNAINVGNIKLGQGPVICHSSIINKKLNQKLIDLAKKYHIDLQEEVAAGRTGTDGDVVHLANQGIPIVLVSIPLRYMHSSIEVCDLNDVQNCIDLIASLLCELEADFNYSPF